MRTEAKIRRRVGAYESRPFKSCLSNSFCGPEELFSHSVSRARMAETIAAKANAMHAIIADAPVNTDSTLCITVTTAVPQYTIGSLAA